jgi:hypothetical protein
MPNTHLRSLLAQARQFVQQDGRIPYDHAVQMLSVGIDVERIERNLRKEFGY